MAALVLNNILTAHGGDAVAEPHLRICLAGSWSLGQCCAAQCPCQARRGCQGAGRQWGAQADAFCAPQLVIQRLMQVSREGMGLAS